MTTKKAKLIKRDQIVETKPRVRVQKPVVKQTIDAVSEWIENKRNQRVDPRAAFAALFAQPQS